MTYFTPPPPSGCAEGIEGKQGKQRQGGGAAPPPSAAPVHRASRGGAAPYSPPALRAVAIDSI